MGCKRCKEPLTRRIRVLVVGMVDSPHLARWLDQFTNQPIDFFVFPSTPNRKIHRSLRQLIDDAGLLATYSTPRWASSLSLPLAVLDLVFIGRLRRSLLVRTMKSSQPHLIHALELQHGGYLAHESLRALRPKVPFFVTNWGSDLYWYRQFPRHRARLTRLLRDCDYYSAECSRDVQIAIELGYKGRVHQTAPNSGGIDLDKTRRIFETIPTSSRNLILIKGYTNFVGRAHLLLKELPRFSAELRNYRIVVYSATIRARLIVFVLRHTRRLPQISAIRKRQLSEIQMLELFGEAVAYVGFSLSDGISTSMLEAMATGCLPLQTSTACIDEWAQRGASIVALDHSNPRDAIEILILTLKQREEKDTMAHQNRAVVEQFAGRKLVRELNEFVYLQILREIT